MTHDEVLARLDAMPDLLRRIAGALTETQARQPGPAGTFSLVEHAWHLADLEREGYGARIARILAEDRPALPDFDGGRIAREREYRRADAALGVAVFADARRRNVERLRGLDAAALARIGVQEGVGEVPLARLPRLMAEHDGGHAAELLGLLSALDGPAPLREAVRAHAAAAPSGAGESRTAAA